MNPLSIWRIARHEFIVNVRRPRFIIFTLSVPLLAVIGVVMSVFFGRQALELAASQLIPSEERVIGLVDASDLFTPLPRTYEEDIRTFADPDSGRAAFDAGELSSLYIIGADYLQTGTIRVLRPDDATLYDGDQLFMEDFLRRSLVNQQIGDGDTGERVIEPLEAANFETVGEDDETGAAGFNFAADFLVPYAFALLLSITIFGSSGYLLGGVAEEKGNRVVEILLSSVDASELLTGKVLGLGALGLVRVLFWIATVVAIGFLTRGWTGGTLTDVLDLRLLLLAIVYYLLGYLTYALILGAGAALGGSVQESQQIGGFLSVFAGLPLYLLVVTVTNPNATIARVLSWIPLTAPTTMIVRLPFGDIPPIDIIGSIAVCTLFLPMVIWAGSRVFRAGLLNYGGKPKLKQVIRMIIQGG
jgi:ABC-2 type transport system permease protein